VTSFGERARTAASVEESVCKVDATKNRYPLDASLALRGSSTMCSSCRILWKAALQLDGNPLPPFNCRPAVNGKIHDIHAATL
jgi:hypothetical protein